MPPLDPPPALPPAEVATDGAAGSRRVQDRSQRTVRHLLVVVVLLLGALAAPRAAAEPTAPLWQWPLAPPHRVVRAFEAPPTPYAAGHRGVDLVGGGTEVRAVDDGVVRFSGVVAGRGTVSILHAGGLVSTYEPVAGSVAAGQTVATGTLIGTLEASGASHCGTTVCLHLGARRGETYVDPMLLLGAHGPSVLLPLEGAAGGGDDDVARGRHGAAGPSAPEGIVGIGSAGMTQEIVGTGVAARSRAGVGLLDGLAQTGG